MASPGIGRAGMAGWVLKLGGSLQAPPPRGPTADAVWRRWLEWAAACSRPGELGGVVVCGGGAFADAVRQAQQGWGFDDLAAHNMAVLAMAQSAQMAHAMVPTLPLLPEGAALRARLAAGGAALWWPLARRARRAGPDTHWGHTSDSMAVDLAVRLGAAQVTLVKACDLPADATLDELARAGIVDAGLPQRVARAGLACHVVTGSPPAAEASNAS